MEVDGALGNVFPVHIKSKPELWIGGNTLPTVKTTVLEVKIITKKWQKMCWTKAAEIFFTCHWLTSSLPAQSNCSSLIVTFTPPPHRPGDMRNSILHLAACCSPSSKPREQHWRWPLNSLGWGEVIRSDPSLSGFKPRQGLREREDSCSWRAMPPARCLRTETAAHHRRAWNMSDWR